MPWKECTTVSEREEFVALARQAGVNLSALSQRFGVSRKTAYKWLKRYEAEGRAGLVDRPRRPQRSPARTAPEMERRICEARREHPAWGGRKLHHWLKAQGLVEVPAPSTITGILERHGLLAADRRRERAWQRFEEEAPNALWQIKGHFAIANGRCHPLTVLDDHSRYNLCLGACGDERAVTVQERLTAVFNRYGLPQKMLMDNGSPWGSDIAHPHTHLTAWLIRLGISVAHGRPYHPQTQGKEERFHRTLALEVLARRPAWADIEEVQSAFDRWRLIYNHERPHEALNYLPPAARYQPSPRTMPASLPPVLYEHGDIVRKVQDKGRISFRGRDYLVGRAFIGEPVALRQSADSTWDVYYCHQRVGRVVLARSARSPDPAIV